MAPWGGYVLGSYFANRFGETFPIGTLVVNVIGFLAGLLFYLLQERASATVQAVVIIGLLGGFTTFSAFGLQTFTLLRDGEVLLATLNLVGSNVLGLLLVFGGYTLGKAL